MVATVTTFKTGDLVSVTHHPRGPTVRRQEYRPGDPGIVKDVDVVSNFFGPPEQNAVLVFFSRTQKQAWVKPYELEIHGSI